MTRTIYRALTAVPALQVQPGDYLIHTPGDSEPYVVQRPVRLDPDAVDAAARMGWLDCLAAPPPPVSPVPPRLHLVR